MVIAALQSRPAPTANPEAQLCDMIARLRMQVIGRDMPRERCHAVFVDARRCYLGDAGVGQGGFSMLSMRMREVFGEALRLDARGLILAHNHPSGDCRPSGCDIGATRRLAELARALDIELIDHLIFTHTSVYSMRAGGLL